MDNLKLFVNSDKVNELGQERVVEACMPISTLVKKHAWIMAVQMPNGQKIAAYPGSSINPYAPPIFYITDKDADTSVHNKAPSYMVVKKLKVHCSDPELPKAVKYLKRAIMSISK